MIAQIGSVLGWAVAVYVGLAILLFLLQSFIIFPGGRNVWRTPDAPGFGWSYDDVELTVNGHTTHGWYIYAPEPARGTLLFSHGNAGTIANRLESAQTFRDLGFNVLLYDYGGYGHSTGRASEARCNADIRAMWDYLTGKRGESPERIVLFGRSLGGGPTTYLAAQVTPGAIILESTFRSTIAVARGVFPFFLFPLELLVRHPFRNEDKVPHFTAPLLVVHSPNDEIIPYSHGRRLYELAPEPKSFLEIRGGHNEGFFQDAETYFEGLAEFLHPRFPIETENPESS